MLNGLLRSYLSGAEDHYLNTRDGNVDLWRDTEPAIGENNTLFSTHLCVFVHWLFAAMLMASFTWFVRHPASHHLLARPLARSFAGWVVVVVALVGHQ